jgi:MFS family permease
VLILLAGHAADRYNRRNLVALALAAQLLCGLLLLAFTLAGLSTVWPVFAVLVLFGSARASWARPRKPCWSIWCHRKASARPWR